MGFKPALATTKVTLAVTFYIRYGSRIAEEQSIDIASLQNRHLHKLHIYEVQAQLDTSNAATSKAQARLDSLKGIVGPIVASWPFAGQVVRQYLDVATVLISG